MSQEHTDLKQSPVLVSFISYMLHPPSVSTSQTWIITKVITKVKRLRISLKTISRLNKLDLLNTQIPGICFNFLIYNKTSPNLRWQTKPLCWSSANHLETWKWWNLQNVSLFFKCAFNTAKFYLNLLWKLVSGFSVRVCVLQGVNRTSLQEAAVGDCERLHWEELLEWLGWVLQTLRLALHHKHT